jgi:hypothetical protein
VQYSLTAEQREHRVECCHSFIEFADQDRDVLQTTVTGDERWCFKYDPETERQSMEWCETNSPWQKKVRLQKSRVETMQPPPPLFADAAGIIHASLFLKAPQRTVAII